MQERAFGPSSIPWLPGVRWMSFARGALAAMFGIFALSVPMESSENVLLVVGLYLVADGGMAVFEGLQRMVHSSRPFTSYVAEGVISIGTGVLALVGSRYVGLVFLVLALRCIAIGVAEVVGGRQLCRETGRTSSFCAWMAGLASLAVGVGLFAESAIDVRVKMLLLGVYGIAFGAALLGFFAETGLTRPVRT
ncbi:MAG: DUF308 domain-containing protein [Myxococcales bacterium]